MRAAAKRRDRIQSTGPFALKIESFEGRDTFLRCGNDQQDFLYCAVVLSEDGRLTIVDNGYRSMEELSEAWTELAGPVEMATLKTRKKNHPRP